MLDENEGVGKAWVDKNYTKIVIAYFMVYRIFPFSLSLQIWVADSQSTEAEQEFRWPFRNGEFYVDFIQTIEQKNCKGVLALYLIEYSEHFFLLNLILQASFMVTVMRH